jgi:hypothetical protein
MFDAAGITSNGERRMSFVERAKGILTNPRQEWAAIDNEPLNVAGLLTGYVLPLAAIGPVASALGWTIFGYGGLLRLSAGAAVAFAITMFIMSIVAVFVCAWVINVLAPTFGATQDMPQAIKVSAYSMTAAWVAGIFNLIPALSPLAMIGGLYSLYLLYVGLPMLMKASADKAMSYTIVVVLVTVVVYIVAGTITRAIAM